MSRLSDYEKQRRMRRAIKARRQALRSARLNSFEEKRALRAFAKAAKAEAEAEAHPS
jgi:hypothetical protein